MAKVYEVVGIANQSILWRGIMFEPAERVDLVLTEEDIEFLGSALSISSKHEILEEKNSEVATAGLLQIVGEDLAVEKPIVEVYESSMEQPKAQNPTTTPKPKPVTKNQPKGSGGNGRISKQP